MFGKKKPPVLPAANLELVSLLADVWVATPALTFDEILATIRRHGAAASAFENEVYEKGLKALHLTLK